MRLLAAATDAAATNLVRRVGGAFVLISLLFCFISLLGGGQSRRRWCTCGKRGCGMVLPLCFKDAAPIRGILSDLG
jgi:hypothetical protein